MKQEIINLNETEKTLLKLKMFIASEDLKLIGYLIYFGHKESAIKILIQLLKTLSQLKEQLNENKERAIS